MNDNVKKTKMKYYFVSFMQRRTDSGYKAPAFEFCNDVTNSHPIDWLAAKNGAGGIEAVLLYCCEISKEIFMRYHSRFIMRGVDDDSLQKMELLKTTNQCQISSSDDAAEADGGEAQIVYPHEEDTGAEESGAMARI